MGGGQVALRSLLDFTREEDSLSFNFRNCKVGDCVVLSMICLYPGNCARITGVDGNQFIIDIYDADNDTLISANRRSNGYSFVRYYRRVTNGQIEFDF